MTNKVKKLDVVSRYYNVDIIRTGNCSQGQRAFVIEAEEAGANVFQFTAKVFQFHNGISETLEDLLIARTRLDLAVNLVYKGILDEVSGAVRVYQGRVNQYARKAVQYPKGSHNYDAIDLIRLDDSLGKLDKYTEILNTIK